MSFVIVFGFFSLIDVRGSTQQSTYTLSNGSKVRIEYHNGKAHVHETTRSGEKRSEDLLTGKPHHKNEKH